MEKQWNTENLSSISTLPMPPLSSQERSRSTLSAPECPPLTKSLARYSVVSDCIVVCLRHVKVPIPLTFHVELAHSPKQQIQHVSLASLRGQGKQAVKQAPFPA